MDFQCGFIVEPDLDLVRFVTTSDANYGKHKDKVIDELYQKQARAIDVEERKKLVRQLEKRAARRGGARHLRRSSGTGSSRTAPR